MHSCCHGNIHNTYHLILSELFALYYIKYVSVINYQLRKDAFLILREMNAFAYCVIKIS